MVEVKLLDTVDFRPWANSPETRQGVVVGFWKRNGMPKISWERTRFGKVEYPCDITPPDRIVRIVKRPTPAELGMTE